MSSVPNDSSDAAFSSNSKVNLDTNETSGNPQTDTEASSTLLTEGLSRMPSVNYSTPMKSETISAYITSINTEPNSLELKSDTSILQTVSSEDRSTFDVRAIMSAQLLSCMTCTLTTNWSVSAWSDSLSIYTDGITSTATSGNASLETTTSSTELNEKVNEIFSVTPLSSMMLETIFAFSDSTDTGSTYIDISKMQTVSSEETTTLDLTTLLSTEWPLNMAYASMTDWSARSDSVSVYTINLHNTETSKNPPRTIDTEYTYPGWTPDASNITMVSPHETAAFDSLDILSTQLFSSNTYTSSILWSTSLQLESWSMLLVKKNGTESSGYSPIATSVSVLNETCSEQDCLASSTSALLETTFTTSGNTESSYFRLGSETYNIQNVSPQSTPVTTTTPITDWSAYVRSDSLSINTESITSNETNGNLSIETGTASTALTETLSETFAMTSSTSTMLETVNAFSASKYTESSYLSYDTEASKKQTLSSEETSALDSTIQVSTEWFVGMTHASNTDLSAWLNSSTTFTININNNETSENLVMKTDTEFTSLRVVAEASTMKTATSADISTFDSTVMQSSFMGLNSELSKIQTMYSEETSNLESNVMMSTQSSSSMTYTPITDLSAPVRSDSLSVDTVSINSIESSENAPTEAATSSTTLTETLSTLFSNTPSQSVMLVTTFAFSALIDTKSAFNTGTSKMQTVSSEDTPTFESTVMLYTQLYSSMACTPITDYTETTMSDYMSIFTVNKTSSERSGHTPIDTEMSSIALNTIFSEIVNLTSSTFVRLDTIFAYITSTYTETIFSGLNTDASKMLTVSSEDTSTYNSTVRWSNQLSSSMTYTPSIVRSASIKLDVSIVKMTSTETSGYRSLERDTSSTELNQTISEIADTLSVYIVSITSTKTSENASLETDTSSLAMNEILSKMFSITSSISLMSETISSFSASSNRESTYLGLNTEASTIKSLLPEETYHLDPMPYTSISHWSASAMFESLSVFTTNINNTATSENPAMKTNTESTYVSLNKESSKIKTVASEEILTFDSSVILFTQLTSSMSYTRYIISSDSTKLDSLPIFTVNITSTETGGYQSLGTTTSGTILNETFSETFTLASSTYVGLEITSVFTTSGKTEHSYIGFDSEESRLQTEASKETSSLNSTVILSIQSSQSMTYTPTTGLSAPARSDSLSVYAVSISSTAASGNAPVETDTSSIALFETLSAILSMTQSTSGMFDTIFAFTSSAYTESIDIGLDTDRSTMQTGLYEKTSSIKSNSITSTEWSSSMTYTSITDLSLSVWSDSLSTFTININNTETILNPSMTTDNSPMNETLSEIISVTPSTSVILQTTFAFSTSTYTSTTFSGVDTNTFTEQTVSSEETSTLDSVVPIHTQLSTSMKYAPTTDWIAFTKSDSLSIFISNITSTESSGHTPIETESSSISLNETLSEIFTMTSASSMKSETAFSFTTSTDAESSFSELNKDTSKMQTVSSEESSNFDLSSIRSTQLSSSMTYTPSNLWSESTKLDVSSILTVNTNDTETSRYTSMETETTSNILNETFSKIFSLTSSTSVSLEITSSFATLGKTESSYFGLDSKIQPVSSEKTSILESTVILFTHSSPNMTYTPTTGLISLARSDSWSKDTVSITSNGISGNIPKEKETSSITMNETLSTLVSNTPSKSVMLETTFTFSASTDTKSAFSGLNRGTSKMQTVSSEETSLFNSASIRPSQSFSSSGYYTISTSSKAPDLGVIIGAVIGCVLLLSFAVFCLLICSFKRKRRQTRSENSEDEVAGNITEPSTSKMNILPLLQPFPEMTATKPMAAKATFALKQWGPLPPITPQLDWIKEIGDSWKKKKKRKHKPEYVQTEGHDTILPNEDQTGATETETGNSNETLGTPDDVISEKRQKSKEKQEKGATVNISTGDFTEREPIKNAVEYNMPTDDITDNDETRKSSKISVSGEHAEGAMDNKAEKKKKRKKKHRRHDEDTQAEETEHGLNTKSEKKKKKKKRKHEMEMGDLLQKEFVQNSDRKEERRTRKHANAEEDLLQTESVNDGDTKNEKRKKKKKKKHRLDVDKELKDECVDDEVEAKQNKRHVDSKYVFQGESINDVDTRTDLKKYPKDRKGIKYELETESSVSLGEKMEFSSNTTTKHENDNEKEHQGEPIDGIDKKPKSERKQKKKIKQRLDLFDEKTHYESAELGNNAEAMNNDKVKDPASLGDFATDVLESEVVSSEYAAYLSEKKKKKMTKKKHLLQEIERENTQTATDMVESDAKRRKRRKRQRAVPMTELDSSEEDVIRARNKLHTEGDNTPRPITSEINKDIAEIKMKPKIAFVELERTQGDFVQDTVKENNEDQNVTTIEGESFA
ncbi:hypothetical protein ACJMK2_016687 [Sinanodonta woodiana]|uniref:Uncharacterized protein n=1 Tax=Sinanodonta woodiana TaxID=1069815 RepID=A0ABD3UVG7_SINWO